MDEIKLYQQNEVIISLLGRLAFPEEALKKIITKKKQNPAAYIRGYNACDGERGVTDLAKVVGVSQPTMTYILQSWKRIGIIYQRGRNYVKLYTLLEDKEEEEKNDNGPGENDGTDYQTDESNNLPDVEKSTESK